MYINVDLESAMTGITGNVHGLRIYVDSDENPSGSAYGLYVDDNTNVDYAIYTENTAPCRFGGQIVVANMTDGDPSVEGQLYSNSGFVFISAG
jgi:hypothetical protein